MRSLVGVCFLGLLFFEVMCCEGCWKQEREALIALNSQMGNYLSWGNTNDCCQWYGVECNTTTGRVFKLKLESIDGRTWQVNYSDLIIFKDLKTLSLYLTQISNCTRTGQGLKNLEVLYSHDSFMMDNAICLDGLSSLKSLSLAGYSVDNTSLHIFQTVLETISSKLLHLEVLILSAENLTNEILPSLRGFTSLKELVLDGIGLDSDLHFQGLCAILKNLEILDLSNNNFKDTDIASPLSRLSSLKSLSLQGSELTMRSIQNISKLRSLEILDLSWNNLGKSIFSSLNGLPRLKSLDLSSNNLNGSFDISGLLNLTSLKILDFSYNHIINFIVHKGSKNLSRLGILALDSNMINGSNLPDSLQAFPYIKSLTLRENEFKGTILARGFRGLSNLEYLALDYSSNLENEFFKSIGDLPSLKVLSAPGCEINGTLPTGDWSKLKNLEELDLSNNEFEGKLPSSFVNMTSLRSLTLANNHFTGNIGPNLASLASLEYLKFEGNQFEFPISFTQFSNHSNLKFIYGNGNKVI